MLRDLSCTTTGISLIRPWQLTHPTPRVTWAAWLKKTKSGVLCTRTQGTGLPDSQLAFTSVSLGLSALIAWWQFMHVWVEGFLDARVAIEARQAELPCVLSVRERDGLRRGIAHVGVILGPVVVQSHECQDGRGACSNHGSSEPEIKALGEGKGHGTILRVAGAGTRARARFIIRNRRRRCLRCSLIEENRAAWSQVRFPNSFVNLGTGRSDPLILAFRPRGRDRGNRLEQHVETIGSLPGRVHQTRFAL